MKRFQSYRPSCVEWIGEIPELWRISKFKYVSKLYTGNSLNDEQKVLYESEDENHIPYVSSKDIDLNSQTVNYDNGLRIPKDNNPFKISPKDSFLLCVEGGSSGRKMVYLDRDVCFVNKLCSFKSIENTRFQYYFIQSSNFQDKFKLSLSGLIGGVSISTLRDFELVLPSIQEQQQIVQFLDEKTEIIDKLISTKKRKITLLKEQRTSLINQVVTKGLNPNVKIKDSGVEWIGEIPEHWDMFRVSNFGVFFKGSGIKKDEVKEEGFPCIRYGEIYTKYDRIVYYPTSYIDLETTKNSVPIKKGDILFTGSGETVEDIGKSLLYFGEENIFVGGDIIVLRLNEGNNPIYLSYLLNSSFVQYQKSLMGRGEIIVHIYSKNIKEIKTPLPPIIEQKEIVEYLDTQTKEIDDLVSLEQRKIDTLKEYRQSLISEVVTGKIKVTTD